MDFLQLLDVIFEGNILFFLAAQFFVLVHFLSEPLRWKVYIPRHIEAGYRKYFEIFSFSALSSYLLPFKLGIPFRIYLLKEKAGLRMGHIASLIAFDGFLYYFSWFLSASVSFIYGAKKSEDISGVFLVLGTGVSILTLILLYLYFWDKEKPFKKKLTTGLRKVGDMIILLHEIRINQYLTNLLIIWIDMASQVARHYFILKMLDVDVGVYEIAAITCLAIFAGMASMMPMGLVGYDATILILLQQSGVPIQIAVLVPLINRLFNIATSIVLGVWGAFSLGYSPVGSVKKIRSAINGA